MASDLIYLTSAAHDRVIVSLQPGLLERLHGHIIDEMTVCDLQSGLSHTGLYLRKR
jgi:hypothetical protein